MSACMSRHRDVMLDIAPPVILCSARDLDNFCSDSDSDSDNDMEGPSSHRVLWRPEDEVYHDDALVYTMSGPPHLQVYYFFD
jgi:hypothetical protein